MTGLGDSLVALIRTTVPALVGSLLVWLGTFGIDVDDDTKTAIIVGLTGLLTAIYYALVTLLERKVNPWFGVLLGVPKAPSYPSGLPPAGGGGGGDNNAGETPIGLIIGVLLVIILVVVLIRLL